MAANLPRLTLDQARYFLRQANQCGIEDDFGFTANLVAAIQFGRNVTWQMQHALSDVSGFSAWYERLQEKMRADPLLTFFNDLRVQIVKRAESPITKVVSVSMEVGVGALVFGSLVVELKRAQPWYRRSFKILWEDLRRRIRRPIDRVRLRIKMAFESWRARWRVGRTSITQEFYFDDPKWRHRPSRELVREYLERLDAIVSEADARFGSNRL